MDHAETQALKANLRREASARRKQAHAAHPQAGLALMQHFKTAIHLPAGAVISGFWPMGDEIDIVPLLSQLHASGHPIGLPVVVGKGEPLIFRSWHPGLALVAGGFKTEVPPHSSPELAPEILIVPLLAFDAEGYRLGYGGGFYDRTLEKLRKTGRKKPLAVGVAFSAQHVARVPRDHYDQPLDWIVTEKNAQAFAASAPSALKAREA
ncbi:MAG TPA: 5-formyltetrahydrofolate cyclo-ligase [Dongiaceae bacterium]|nr:5-formyltetrahydrofolate cyclo-ligase [Dongiaceae bacterium]